MQEVDFRFQRLQRQQEEHELFRKLFFGLNGELEGLKLSTTERGGRVRMFIHHRGLILKAIPLEWELFFIFRTLASHGNPRSAQSMRLYT